jgi:thiol-disulfide isomerase/thioredoxin
MMLTRRSTFRLAAIAAAMTFAGSFAAAAAPNEPKDFDQAAFQQAQKQGEPILIDIYASWCDVCKRQAAILDTLRKTPKYASLVTFRINYDTQKDLMRTFKATVQSTLILYRGQTEVGRSVGETQPEWIEDLVSKAFEGQPPKASTD